MRVLLSSSGMGFSMRYSICTLALCTLLAACGGPDDAAPETPDAETAAPAEGAEGAATGETGEETEAEAGLLEQAPYGSLAWAVEGDWRGDQTERDEWRNPQETIEFLDIDPSGTIVEIWPGAGWYTQVLAPWIAANEGRYVAAYFPTAGEERLIAFRDNYVERFSDPRYGEIEMTEFGPETGPILAPGSADRVLTFRNVHNWMSRGFAEKAFADFYEVLAPGGVLGVVEHRLPASREQDPRAASGYVQEDYVVALAQEAGFELVEASEINANPADAADHPFGVWTLPPVSRIGEDAGEDFDPDYYTSIGESDRMTLRFVKPAAGDEAADGSSESVEDDSDTGENGDDTEG